MKLQAFDKIIDFMILSDCAIALPQLMFTLMSFSLSSLYFGKRYKMSKLSQINLVEKKGLIFHSVINVSVDKIT